MERTFDNNQTNIFAKYIWSHCGTTVRHACWLPWFPTKITIHQARVLRGARKKYFVEKNQKILLKFCEKSSGSAIKMAKKFFPDDWEKIAQDELIRSRARLSGFIEAIPDTKEDKDKLIKDVSIREAIFIKNVRANITSQFFQGKSIRAVFCCCARDQPNQEDCKGSTNVLSIKNASQILQGKL
jgi:hypothetical protein